MASSNASEGNRKGLFVVLEGIDGAGTTTQGRMLARWLEQHGRTVELCCEPTDGPVGSLIRKALQKDGPELGERVFALLFAADRVDHIEKQILPAIEAGQDVISDRYVLSSLAYQSAQLDLNWVRGLNLFAFEPDIALLLDAPADLCMDRLDSAGRGGERYEKTQLLEQIRLNYRQIASMLVEEGQRLETLDASLSIEELHQRIVEMVQPLLQEQ